MNTFISRTKLACNFTGAGIDGKDCALNHNQGIKEEGV
jgi:hypothetical protein